MENYVGKRLDGRYEIMEIIGIGGMAVVYKAFDNIDHKIVAVKILKDEFIANEEFRRRFKNESKAIAVLSHQNIVKVYDVSYGDMLQYIVMEYVDGITLKEYMLQQGKIDPREAIYFLTQILRALQHAHDKGIVHRDIKPQNIMLKSDGTIKVTDFGIARFSRSETRTMTDGAIGSVHYISPEQAKGSITDAKTDLYSVGVILYEMLTGRLPFQSDNAVSVALMQLQNDPVKPREINPDIPVGLEQIIMRAMQKSQNDRYQSASEILLDLDAYKKNPNIKFDYSFDDAFELPTKTAPEYSQNSIDNIDAPEDDEDYIDEAAQRRSDRGKKVTITILTAVLVALVVFAGVLISMFSSASNKIVVPEFTGKYFEDVKTEYGSVFKFEPEFQPNSTYPEGVIFHQDIESGKKVRKNTTIKVYVSGESINNGIEIPDVSEYTLSVAETKLKNLNFKVEVIAEYDDTVEKGTILRTEPEAGERAPVGSLVTIFYSTDKKPVLVPRVVGMKVGDARRLLEDLGLKVETRSEDNKQPLGTVLGQSEVDYEVEPGTVIILTVSTGIDPQEIEIPDLAGQKLSAAEAALKELDLEVVVEYQDDPLPKDTVISVVDSGKKVPPKTVVTLIVSSGVVITEPSTTETTQPSTTENKTTHPQPSTTEPTTTEPPTSPTTTEPSTAPTTTEPSTAPTTTEPTTTAAAEENTAEAGE